MPRRAMEDDSRMSLQLGAEERAAKDVTPDSARLSERDSLRVLELLKNPPAPNERMRAATLALPRHTKS